MSTRSNTPQEAHLNRLREALASVALVLLETRWLGWNAAYRFRCPQGHESARAGTQISRFLIALPTCREASHALAKLAQLREIAGRAGGECLSAVYRGADELYFFRCQQGHHFESRGKKVFAGSWCRRCAQLQHSEAMRDAHGLARLKDIAQQRGGTCLAERYTKQADPYPFRCAAGHEWATTGADVLRGAWCARCAHQARREAYRRPDGLAAMQQMAQSHGGQCLTNAYLGTKARYRFSCAAGHEWETNGAGIFRGAWCPTCAQDQKRLGIASMRDMALARGGRCLSDLYVNTATKLAWECARGHRWQAVPGAIRQGHWCPECAILARITNPKTRRRRRYEAVFLDLETLPANKSESGFFDGA